jgi:hypothetical protein
MSLHYAKELMEKFPKETEGFTVFEVEKIWQEYSDRMAATWMNPDKESVEREFNYYRK